jgi:hypothetical protein
MASPLWRSDTGPASVWLLSAGACLPQGKAKVNRDATSNRRIMAVGIQEIPVWPVALGPRRKQAGFPVCGHGLLHLAVLWVLVRLVKRKVMARQGPWLCLFW